jgi:hypothetical protein
MRLASSRAAATLLTGLATAFACASASAETPDNEPVVVLIIDDEEAVEELEEALLDYAYDYGLGPDSAVGLDDMVDLLGWEDRAGDGLGLVQPGSDGITRDHEYEDDGYWDMDMSLTAGDEFGGALLIIDRRSGTITLRASLSPAAERPDEGYGHPERAAAEDGRHPVCRSSGGPCDIAIPLYAALESLRSDQPGRAIILTGDDDIQIVEGDEEGVILCADDGEEIMRFGQGTDGSVRLTADSLLGDGTVRFLRSPAAELLGR